MARSLETYILEELGQDPDAVRAHSTTVTYVGNAIEMTWTGLRLITPDEHQDLVTRATDRRYADIRNENQETLDG